MDFNKKFIGEKPFKLRQVVFILIFVLMIGLLFCSTNLMKWAEDQQIGPARDISLSLITPLHSFARFCSLDVLELWVTAGFEKIPGVKTGVKELTHRSVGKNRKSGKERFRDQKYSEANPLQVLCFGDSNISEFIGINVQRDLLANKAIRMERIGKYSTGLSRPDFFDWPKTLEPMLSSTAYGCAILMIGENDAQDFVDNKKIYRFGSDGWNEVYENRFQGMMNLLLQYVNRVYVIGLPPMRDLVFDKRMSNLNRIYGKVTALFPNAVFIDTIGILGDEKGKYRQYMLIDKKQRSVRQLDGVHVSDAGGKLVSARIAEIVTADFVFEAAPKTQFDPYPYYLFTPDSKKPY